MNKTDIKEITKRLLPITELRRNAGAILDKLPEVGSFILTKSGKPVAEILALEETKKKLFKKSKGAWVGTELEKIDFYKLILKRRKAGSRKAPVKL